MKIGSLLSPLSYLFRSCLPHSIFGGETSGSGGSFKAFRERVSDALYSFLRVKQENIVKVNKDDLIKRGKHFLSTLAYVFKENKGFLDSGEYPISGSTKEIIESTTNFFEKSRSEKDFHLEDIHKILKQSGEGDDPSREDFCQRAWLGLSKAAASYERKGMKHPDELLKLFNLVMPHEIRQRIWDNLSSDIKTEMESLYEKWKERKHKLNHLYKEKFNKFCSRERPAEIWCDIFAFNALNPAVLDFIPHIDKTIALFYFSRCYLSPESHQRLEEEIFSQLNNSIYLYPRDDQSGEFYLPEQLADELSNEESPFRAGFIDYLEKILECEPNKTRVQDLLSPDHLKTGLDTLAQWVRKNKTLFQSGKNDYAFALRGYFMKLRFDRMYKAVENDAPLKRLLLLFCFQEFWLKKYSFDTEVDPLSEEELRAEIKRKKDRCISGLYGYNPDNLCLYDHYISIEGCIIGECYFGALKERNVILNQRYGCSNSNLYAVPFMYYLKECFQPSKDREVLSQLFKDALLVRSKLKA